MLIKTEKKVTTVVNLQTTFDEQTIFTGQINCKKEALLLFMEFLD